MKFSLTLATAAACAVLSLFQTGCADGVVAVGPAPVPYYAYARPGYPVAGWGGAGFYGGASYYRSPGWNNRYYHNGSGSINTWRGGSANWGGGSGSASGWRGGSASWGGGSGSWHSARGGSGSWHR
jgi:hypothetical protein